MWLGKKGKKETFHIYSMKVNDVNQHKFLQKNFVWIFIIEESQGRHVID